MANTNAITKKQIDFNNNSSLPDVTNKSGEELLAAMWGLNKEKTKQISNISRVYFTKHGMFASVPILCRGQDCAYKDVCMVDPSERTVGCRCPMEIAALVTRFNQWCQHFNINIEGETIAAKDLVDASLIKDLVDIEIQILRVENKIALSGDFMSETLIEVDKKCNAYYGNVVTPESEFLITLQDKKIKLLNQLNATRKDKAVDKRKETASDEAVRIFQQMQELQKKHNKSTCDIMDIEFDDEGNIIEENSINSDQQNEENDIKSSQNKGNNTNSSQNVDTNNINSVEKVDENDINSEENDKNTKKSQKLEDKWIIFKDLIDLWYMEK